MRLSIAASLIPLLVACVGFPPSDAQAGDAAATAPLNADADAMYRRFAAAYRTLDAALVRGIYTADCSYLQPSETSGIEECEVAIGGFRQMFEDAAKEGRLLDIAFKIARRRTHGDTIVDVGYYRLKASDGAVPSYGKFVVMMERDASGALHFAVDGYSAAPAAVFDALDAPVIEAPPGS